MLLDIKNLRKDYQRGSQHFSAVNNVSFSMAQTDFISRSEEHTSELQSLV